MTAVKGSVKEGAKEFDYLELSSGVHRGIQITEKGTKEKDATHTYYLYSVGQDGKLHNIHDLPVYNKNQAGLYKGLAAALARKWVTQSKWPADGWEFTFEKEQIKLMKDKK
jgi:hypothetical protein